MLGKLVVLSLVWGAIAGCQIQGGVHKRMELDDLLAAVRNDRIEFATVRPAGSQLTTLDRRVVVTNPPELIELSEMGDVRVLDELVRLLRDPERAWAAMVLLVAMTRVEENIVNAFAARPDEWWDSVGGTAYERWTRWLGERRGRLVWDIPDKVFVETR